MDKLTSGAGQWLLPLAVAGASIAAPKIGHGLTAGLGVLDWAQRRNKVEEEKSAYAAFPKYFSGGAGAQPPTALTTAALAGGEGGTTPTPTPSGPAPATAGGVNIVDAMNDPAVQKSPAAMAFLAHIQAQKALAEPHRQLVPTASGEMGMLTTPRYGGTPSLQTLPGVGKQTFGQGLEDMLFATFGKGPHTPEQVQQAQGLLLKQVEDKENRQLSRQFELQEKGNNNYWERLKANQKFSQDQALLAAGRGDVKVLNNHLYTDLGKINTEAAKARAALYVNGQPMRKATLQADLDQIEQQKQDAINSVHENYLTQWGDLQTQYPFLQGMKGGTPGYVQGQIDRSKGAGNVTDDAIIGKLSPVDATSFQNALKANAGNPDILKRIRQDALRMIRR